MLLLYANPGRRSVCKEKYDRWDASLHFRPQLMDTTIESYEERKGQLCHDKSHKTKILLLILRRIVREIKMRVGTDIITMKNSVN